MYTNRPQVMQKHFPLRDKASLYDLETDLGEQRNVAADHPDVVERLTKLAAEFDRNLRPDRRPEAVLPP
jgi:hypothetical protein